MFRCSYTIFRDITVGSAKVTKILNDKIQGDQKVSVHPMITIQKITSNFPSVPPARLQTFIDMPNCVLKDRVQYCMIHIPNVFCDGHLQIISFVAIVLYCNSQVHRDFLSTLYNTPVMLSW